MLNLLIGPIINKIAMELMESEPETGTEANREKAKGIVKTHLKPFYKQKTFWSAIAVIVAGVLNYLFGWDIPVDSLFCG